MTDNTEQINILKATCNMGWREYIRLLKSKIKQNYQRHN